MRGSRRGFTVTEMMVAVLISVILGAIAISGFTLYERTAPVDHVGRRLTYLFSVARTQAITNNQYYTVQIDMAQNMAWLDETDESGNILVPKVMHPEHFDAGVEIYRIMRGTSVIYPATVGPDPVTQVGALFAPDGSSDDLRIFISRVDADVTNARNVDTVRLYGPTGQSRNFEKTVLMP